MKEEKEAKKISEQKPKKEKKEEEEVSPQIKEKVEELKLLSQSLKEEKEKAKNYYEQLLYLKAEFENYKKRKEKEFKAIRKETIKEIVKEGVILIFKELDKIFSKYQVKKMDCIGKEFSPHFHNAVLQEKTDSCKEGSILKVIENGYMIGEEVLKPAVVVVASKKEKHPDEVQDKNLEEKGGK